MVQEEKYKITSEDYADFLTDDLLRKDILILDPNASFLSINNDYSVAFIPETIMKENIIYTLDYEAIPKCFGLMSVTGFESTEGLPLHNISNDELTGQGVLLGIVDTGIDYRNTSFQYADHTSRIVSIWDQTIESENNYPEGFYYGTEFLKEQIDSALSNENPLSIVPSMDEIGHGTTLAGVAGGSYYIENGFMGVAPNAEFVVVKLKAAKQYLKDFFYLPQDTICYQENDIILGINYLVQVANELNRPISICIGLGSSQGAHIGGGFFNNYLASLGRFGNVAIAVAAGNEGNSGHHYFGEIDLSLGFDDIQMYVGDNTPGFFMEFWGSSPSVFTVDIFSPTGEFIGNVPTIYEQQRTIQFDYNNTVILVDNTLEYSIAGDQLILFRFRTPSSGIWRFKIYDIGNMQSQYHVWLPISDFISDTYFVDADPYTTITRPGNEETILTVTAYNPVTQGLYYNASKGFTKRNEPKPDITCPGVNILAPTLNNQYIGSTGTSVAAAYATGVIAMLLEWGIIRGNQVPMQSVLIRSLLTNGARRFPDMIYPNPDWGFGIVDIS